MVNHVSTDIETLCALDLKKVGLSRYARHKSARILMIAWSLNRGPVQIWDCTDGSPMPSELRRLLDDPETIWHAFNAAFERGCFREIWGIDIPPERWRCTMIRAFQQSFAGTLGQIGEIVGLPAEMQKDKEGERLIRIFCMPQRVTKNQPFEWRDGLTDPEDWKRFLSYCKRDVVAESEILRRLDKYPSPDVENDYYAITERKNDAGIPIDRNFIEQAITMVARRKAELRVELVNLTGLSNPNSPTQLTTWLCDRGFPFGDINKNTVKKVLAESADGSRVQTQEVIDALLLRQQAGRTSVSKFDAILDRANDDDMMRHAFQFAGAQRTNRESGRGAQPHNLPRPPDWLEDDYWRDEVTETVRRGDYDWLSLLAKEPLDALVGVVRSAFCAPDGYEFVVADLVAIESAVYAYLSGDPVLMDIVRTGKDPYKAFATFWFGVAYEDVTKYQRKLSKPGMLGCQYRMGPGAVRDGKKTGLLGYAEAMGIIMTQGEADAAVRTWRERFSVGKQYWYDLENAIMTTLRSGVKTRVGCMTFDLVKPYLRAMLPTGRYLYYHLPRVTTEHGTWPNGEPYSKPTISYMGKDQITGRWCRLYSHGGKFAENFTQALAREILYIGKLRAFRAGFDIRLTVHDEIGALRKIGDERFSLARLEQCMTDPIDSLPGIPLRADGWVGPYYRK